MRLELQQAERDDIDNKRRIREQEVKEEEVCICVQIIPLTQCDVLDDNYTIILVFYCRAS